MRRDPGPVFVGLDLGTSALKGLALDVKSRPVAAARAAYPTLRPGTGRAEQSVESWRRALRSVLRRLRGATPGRHWAAVGLTGMIPTAVLAGPDGEPVGPAITWEDTRAARQAARLLGEPGDRALYELTGQRLDGRYLLPMWMWLAENEPGRAAVGRRLMSAKDLLFWWLTGERATDPSTAAGFGALDLDGGVWSEEVLTAAGRRSGGRRPDLPPVLPSVTLVPATPSASDLLGIPPGTPVCLGAADSVAAAAALGAVAPGQVAYVTGTSTVILGISSAPARDPLGRYIVTPLETPSRWGLEMDQVSTGSAVAWLDEVLGRPERGIMRLAGRSEVGARGVSFLPYLGLGEQGALWDPSLRGSVDGLTLSHRPADVARALVEGLVLESRRCLSVLDQAVGPGGDVLLTAGWAGARLFRRALADATGRAIVRVGRPDWAASAHGAASIAAQATGAGPLAPPRTPPSAREAPDPAAARLWDDLWDRHERRRASISRPGAAEA